MMLVFNIPHFFLKSMSSKAGDFVIPRTRVFSQMILALNHHKDRWYFSLPISAGRKEYLRAPVPWDLPRQPIKWVCHDGKQAISADVKRKRKGKNSLTSPFFYVSRREKVYYFEIRHLYRNSSWFFLSFFLGFFIQLKIVYFKIWKKKSNFHGERELQFFKEFFQSALIAV